MCSGCLPLSLCQYDASQVQVLVAFNSIDLFMTNEHKLLGFLSRPPAVGGGKSSKQSTSGGIKAWAVLVQNFILFMARPYGATVNITILLLKWLYFR